MTDTKFYLDELKSDECQCGKKKRPRNSFCYACYSSLPKDMQRDLYLMMDGGYEQAYDAAVHHLNS
jgi:hypothetical protein